MRSDVNRVTSAVNDTKTAAHGDTEEMGESFSHLSVYFVWVTVPYPSTPAGDYVPQIYIKGV